MQPRSKVTTWAGVDVGGKELTVTLVRGRNEPVHLTIPNTPDGHATLRRALRKKAGIARVALEATGTYHLDLALLLARTDGIELMVVNPLAARRFAQAQMRRAKTDRVDAQVLLEFCQRMAFEPWAPPSPAALELRNISRHLAALIADQTALKNRLHAAQATETTPRFVLADLADQTAAIAERILRCQAEGERVAHSDPDLQAAFSSLLSMPGLAERSAVLLLGELAVLDPSMSPDEVVGHAGLDPRPIQSGTRGNKDTARKISKVGNSRIRAAMFMVAHNAAQRGVVGEFRDRLIARNKPYYLAQTAVMRRLLRVCWVLIVKKASWDGALFAPRPPRRLATTDQIAQNSHPAP